MSTLTPQVDLQYQAPQTVVQSPQIKPTGPLPPGRCTPDDLVRLAQLTKGKDVLMIGAYCGRAAAAIGLVCKSLLVIEDFQSYQGDWTACAHEFMRVCEAYDERISLLMHSLEDADEEHFGTYDVVYIDADYPGDIDEALTVALDRLKMGGILLHHGSDGGIQEGLKATWGAIDSAIPNVTTLESAKTA